MGIFKEAPTAPDTYGLPEYNVNKSFFEIDGANVRMVFGERRFGQLHWHYCVLMTAEDLLQVAYECQRVAEEAFETSRMMMCSRKDH
jgi:hypothetical protein